MASTCPLGYQTIMYTKKQVCELLRKHGVHDNDVDKSLDMVEQLRKHNTERQRKYMQFKRENDPEFMDRIRKAKSEYFQRNKAEIVEKQKMKYQNDPVFHETMKTYQREYKRAYRARKKLEQQSNCSDSTNSGSTSDASN